MNVSHFAYYQRFKPDEEKFKSKQLELEIEQLLKQEKKQQQKTAREEKKRKADKEQKAEKKQKKKHIE